MFKTLTEFGFLGGNTLKCLNLFRLLLVLGGKDRSSCLPPSGDCKRYKQHMMGVLNIIGPYFLLFFSFTKSRMTSLSPRTCSVLRPLKAAAASHPGAALHLFSGEWAGCRALPRSVGGASCPALPTLPPRSWSLSSGPTDSPEAMPSSVRV